MISPQVTVILTSLNHAKYLRAAIESVLAQTYENFELFIVDDASEDDSWELIQSYPDPRIIAIRNQQRMRGVYGLNEIIKNRARGEYIVIHHSDDIWLPEKLERQVAYLDSHHEVGAVFSRVELIDENGCQFADELHQCFTIFKQPNRNRFEWLRFFFLEGNCLCHPSVMARRSVMLEAGLYDRRMGQLSDFDIWVRICLRHEIYIIEEPLTQFRIRDGELNQSGDKKDTSVRVQNEWLWVLRRYLSINNEPDFFSIFPEMRSKGVAQDNNLPYLLACRALQTQGSFRMAFGLNLLYDLFSDEAIAKEIFDKYSFNYIDLIALSAQVDPMHAAEAYGMRNQIKDLWSEIDRIKATISWQVTKPLRLISNLPGIIKNMFDTSNDQNKH